MDDLGDQDDEVKGGGVEESDEVAQVDEDVAILIGGLAWIKFVPEVKVGLGDEVDGNGVEVPAKYIGDFLCESHPECRKNKAEDKTCKNTVR